MTTGDASLAAGQIGDALARFRATCEAASEQEGSFRPSAAAWAMSHVVEHVALANRSTQPPGIAVPTGALANRPRALAELDASARAVLAWADAAATDLRNVGIPHPLFGVLDGVQWLAFVGAHHERHRAQLIGLARLAKHA